MKSLSIRIALLASACAIIGAGFVAPSSAAPKAAAACTTVQEPPSVACGKFYRLVRVCPGLGTRKVIGRRQNIC